MMMFSSLSSAMKVHFFLFLLLLLSLGFSDFFSEHFFVHGDANLFSDYCKNTTSPVVCGTCMLATKVGLIVQPDLKSMINHLLSCAFQRMKVTADSLENITKDNTTDPNLVHTIFDCTQNSVQDISTDLNAAWKNLESGNYTGVKVEIWKSQSHVFGCFDKFQKINPKLMFPAAHALMQEVLEYQTITHATTTLVDLL